MDRQVQRKLPVGVHILNGARTPWMAEDAMQPIRETGNGAGLGAYEGI